jgi:membrane protein
MILCNLRGSASFYLVISVDGHYLSLLPILVPVTRRAQHPMNDHTKDEHAEDWRSHIGEEPSSGGRSDDLTRAGEPGRGREAITPTAIPARGWKDILWRVFWSIPDDRILSTSGGVAFFALLAVFPAIATVVSLYGLFADTGTIRGHLSLLTGILPSGVLELIGEQITLIITQDSDALSLAFVVGFLVALWSANSGVAALFDALNVVYGEKEKRSLLRFYATSFLFTLGMISVVMAAISAVVVAPIIFSFMGFVTPAEQFLAVLRWPVLLVVVCAWLAMIYRYGPSREDAKWRWVTWGSVMAAGLWLGASMLFSWYVANFDSYNKTYGSLGAGVGFMIWIWLSVVIVLLGAELNAEMEHQTANDSTEGPSKPLGSRGANMADHVGASHA